MIKANFSGDDVPKRNVYYTCIASITIDSVIKMEKKELFTSLFRRVQTQNKGNKDVQAQNTELESESESGLKSGTKLESKSELESDTE